MEKARSLANQCHHLRPYLLVFLAFAGFSLGLALMLVGLLYGSRLAWRARSVGSEA